MKSSTGRIPEPAFKYSKERCNGKIVKSKEKTIRKVLLNAAHIKGSIEGISDADKVKL
jgi:hypothetical protein